MKVGGVTGFIREMKRKAKLKRDRAAARQRLQELWPGGVTGFLKEFEADRGKFPRLGKFWLLMARLGVRETPGGLMLTGCAGEAYDRMTDEERRIVFLEMTRWRYHFESRLREYADESETTWPDATFLELRREWPFGKVPGKLSPEGRGSWMGSSSYPHHQ
jgi:hypothetical protein